MTHFTLTHTDIDDGKPHPEPTKGAFNQMCNRGVCGCRDATYFNHSTRKYYCRHCAMRINMHNPEFERLNDRPLCEQILSASPRNDLKAYSRGVVYRVTAGVDGVRGLLPKLLDD